MSEAIEFLAAWAPHLAGSELKMLIAILQLCSERNADIISISGRELQAASGVSERTFYDAVVSLEKRGLISIVRARSKNLGDLPNVYMLPSNGLPYPAIHRHFQRSQRMDPQVRQIILDRDGLKCQYCGTVAALSFHIDHIVPFTLGGPAASYNFVVACGSCNSAKNNRVWVPQNLNEITSEHLAWREWILTLAVPHE